MSAKTIQPLTDEVADRLEQADVDQLLGWSERVFTATTVDDVFAD